MSLSNNHIIVVGGRDNKGPTASVEVLDVASLTQNNMVQNSVTT